MKIQVIICEAHSAKCKFMGHDRLLTNFQEAEKVKISCWWRAVSNCPAQKSKFGFSYQIKAILGLGGRHDRPVARRFCITKIFREAKKTSAGAGTIRFT